LRETRSKLATIFEKYSVDGKLSYVDMAKYNRLTQLENELVTVFGETQTKINATLSRVPENVYKDTFSLNAYNIEQMAGTKLNWGVLPKDAIKAVASNPLDLIARNSLSQNMRTNIRRAIMQGTIQGKSYADMAKDIKGVYNVTANKALVIARTEGQRAMAEGKQASYAKADKLGIKMRLFWDAYLDSRTRDNHAIMNGVEAEEHNGEMMFYYSPTGQWVTGPMDPTLPASEIINCRCTTRQELADEPVGQGQDLSYEDWQKTHRF